MGKSQPKVLCIGGSDPAQGAGVQMDARVVRAFGMEALTVVTVDTVQNEEGLQQATPRRLRTFADDLLAALEAEPSAVKLGALGDELLTEAVTEMLEPWVGRFPMVLDPVTQASRAKDGVSLNTKRGQELMWQHLLPLVTVATPNQTEFALAEQAYRQAGACLVKGGHASTMAVHDVLLQTGQDPVEIVHSRLAGATEIHGTGCALASALACLLAEGQDLETAAQRAIQIMHGWLQDTIAQEHRELVLKPPRWMRDKA